MSEGITITTHKHPSQRRRWGKWSWFKQNAAAQDDYTIVNYPNTGYIIQENGDITLPDGTLPPPGVAITISPEHLKISVERKKRAAERGE